MRCAQLRAIGSFDLVECTPPEIKKGEVLVAVRATGICGSDVHYYRQGRIGDQVIDFPQQLGHESAGIVARAFSGSRFREGDRVAIEPGLSCGECEHCLAGCQNRCPSVRFLGSPGMPGAYAEYVVCDQRQLASLPDELSFDEGAMLEPLGVGLHAVRLAGLTPGETVGIFGAGPIGLVTLAMARAAGVRDIYLADRLAYRLAFAQREYGVEHVIDATRHDPAAYIAGNTGGRGLDCTFDAAGEQQTIDWTLEAARIGGRALIIGIPETDTIVVDPHGMRRKELLVRNVRRSNRTLEPCIDLVRRGIVSVGPMATHHFSLERIGEGFETVAGYRDGVIRAMVTIP
jgi:L-iditol 2-dehydrogenase